MSGSQNHDFSVLDQCEFEQSEQGVEDSSCIQGKLRANFPFWRDVVRASEFVLDIIQNGYKILFRESPLPFSIENRSSALHRRSFVQGAISELLTRGCIREAPVYPQFCNPLHVAVQSSRKLRLILDLSHLNKFIVKKFVKYKDLRTVLPMFLPGCPFSRLILSQPITTSIFVKSTGNFCRLSGLLPMELWNFTNLRFCLLV